MLGEDCESQAAGVTYEDSSLFNIPPFLQSSLWIVFTLQIFNATFTSQTDLKLSSNWDISLTTRPIVM